MGIGKNIEQLRKQNHLTQGDLGNMLDISNKTISSWEKDRTEPNIGMIEAMCEIFHCQKSDLIDGMSIEYLTKNKIPRDKDNEPISDEVIQLFALYEKASPEVKKAVEILLKAEQ